MTSAPRTVVIADDEPLARERIRMLLEPHGRYRVVAEAATGDEALAELRRHQPDLAFLDISMPGLSGVEVADQSSEESGRVAVVFVTAHDEFALRAFEVGALDYLVKPVDRERFDQTIARIERRGHGSPVPTYREDLRALLESLTRESGFRKRFVIRTPKGHYFVSASDIEAAVADGNYVTLHAAGRAHLLRETMKGLEERLDPERFIRIHRSAIVNVDFISRIEPQGHAEYVVVTRGGLRVESSRAYADRLRLLLR
jgi:two-component system LytT family response regulator